MVVCISCKAETHTAIYKPVRMEPDGYFKLDGPLCRACAAPPPSTTSTSFVKGGGSAQDVRPPSGPRTVGGYYTGGERTGVKFI